jgi:hypothetical protein
MKLSLRAYEVRRGIQHILATAPPHEIPDRIEDVVYDALAELERGTRRALRREYAENAITEVSK